MPGAVLTDAQWEQVKLASIAGLPDHRIAKEYNVSRGAIRKKRQRGGWPTQTRVEIEKEKAREALRNQGKSGIPTVHGTEEVSQAGTVPPLAIEMVGKAKEEIGEMNRMVALQRLSPFFQKAVTDGKIMTPQSLDEAIKLGNFLHKMADLDKPESSVTVSVWGSSTSLSQDLRDVEGQARTVSDEEKKLLGEWG